VVDALLKLLDDQDPNIRAVAAISLGRTGAKEKTVIKRLMVLLDDKDRICRQSACLSLGHIKAEEAVDKISYLWYVMALVYYALVSLGNHDCNCNTSASAPNTWSSYTYNFLQTSY